MSGRDYWSADGALPSFVMLNKTLVLPHVAMLNKTLGEDCLSFTEKNYLNCYCEFQVSATTMAVVLGSGDHAKTCGLSLTPHLKSFAKSLHVDMWVEAGTRCAEFTAEERKAWLRMITGSVH